MPADLSDNQTELDRQQPDSRKVTVVIGNMAHWPGVYHDVVLDRDQVSGSLEQAAADKVFADREFYPEGPPEYRSFDLVGIYLGEIANINFMI